MSQYRNIAQAKAIERKNRERLLKINEKLDDNSGIYFLTRVDEDNIRYFYIGQALHILQRMCSHLVGYQHIDLSLKKRGFYSEENPYGWKLNFIHYPAAELDKWEQHYILAYTKAGYQCRYNKTAGGQGQGKEKINEFKPAKGYRDGIKQGKIVLARELSAIAEKYLKIEIREEFKGKKIPHQQYEKFMAAMNEENYKE